MVSREQGGGGGTVAPERSQNGVSIKNFPKKILIIMIFIRFEKNVRTKHIQLMI